MSFNLESYRKHPFFIPMTSAVALHLIFITLSFFIRFPGVHEITEKTVAAFHLKNVDLVPRGVRPQGVSHVHEYSKQLRFVGQTPDNRSALPVGPPLEKEMPLGQKGASEETRDTLSKKSESDNFSEKNRDFETILLEAQEREMKERVGPPRKVVGSPLASAAKKVGTRPVSVNQEGLLNSLKKPLTALGFYSSGPMDVDPEEGMPGFTPASHGALGSGFSNFEFGEGIEESKGNIVKYESIDDFLDIEVFTYQDPPTQAKYYMIKIFAKKGKSVFKVVPKEILFTVDASLSISQDRLDEFKRGISYCLTHLNKEDLFNIIAFKDKVTFFSPHSVSATPEMIKDAEHFVSDLTSNQQTDVYLAFNKIVETPPARIPSNVILISDGRPTHGLVDSREVIASITRINKKARPIFTFSGGARVNRYLLDFVAYQNRGWSQFMKTSFEIHSGLAKFYEKIKDPIFLGLRYRLNNLDESEAFPRSLPDFYVGAEFTLFGSYKDEDAFSMQLLGDVDGKTKELIFTRSLKDAKRGNDDIMRGFAFNKIYYLISRLTTEGSDPQVLKEIHDLSKRYKVTTPYSPELEK